MATTLTTGQQSALDALKDQPKAEAQAPRKVKIPQLNPYLAPMLFCSNRDCRQPMEAKIINDRGGEAMLQYDCEPCGYSFFGSLVHAQGMSKPIGQKKEGPPEVMQVKR